ncbi:hypothetical protein SLE2022_133680 [Rubroshorea leprosula]
MKSDKLPAWSWNLRTVVIQQWSGRQRKVTVGEDQEVEDDEVAGAQVADNVAKNQMVVAEGTDLRFSIDQGNHEDYRDGQSMEAD